MASSLVLRSRAAAEAEGTGAPLRPPAIAASMSGVKSAGADCVLCTGAGGGLIAAGFATAATGSGEILSIAIRSGAEASFKAAGAGGAGGCVWPSMAMISAPPSVGGFGAVAGTPAPFMNAGTGSAFGAGEL